MSVNVQCNICANSLRCNLYWGKFIRPSAEEDPERQILCSNQLHVVAWKEDKNPSCSCRYDTVCNGESTISIRNVIENGSGFGYLQSSTP